MLSITTDYINDTDNPKPYLRHIAEAGFSHIHWCHHWNTDFIYSTDEISHIKSWLNEFSLQLLDLHGSSGKENIWWSNLEPERLAGVELVKNRIDMTSELGSDVIVMHADEYSDALRKSLDELESYAKERNVRIAIENCEAANFSIIEKLFNEYTPDYVGLCYDSGHGNIQGAMGLDNLKRFSDRLIAIHLHDNDGKTDQHKPLFSGTIDWDRLTTILAESAYKKPLNLEVSTINAEIKDEKTFLQQSFETGNNLSKMLDKKKVLSS